MRLFICYVLFHAAQTSTVTLYEHCNYAGLAVIAGVGTYNTLPAAVSSKRGFALLSGLQPQLVLHAYVAFTPAWVLQPASELHLQQDLMTFQRRSASCNDSWHTLSWQNSSSAAAAKLLTQCRNAAAVVGCPACRGTVRQTHNPAVLPWCNAHLQEVRSNANVRHLERVLICAMSQESGLQNSPVGDDKHL
jgi:hypothetical protein